MNWYKMEATDYRTSEHASQYLSLRNERERERARERRMTDRPKGIDQERPTCLREGATPVLWAGSLDVKVKIK